MNIFEDFARIAGVLHQRNIPYALCGGVSLAFHGLARFTRDIDLVVPASSMDALGAALATLDYEPSAEPWAFAAGHFELHRFARVEGELFLLLDILSAQSPEALHVIEDAIWQQDSVGTPIAVASKESLVWMKRLRGSAQDLLDIQTLESP